MNAKSKTAIRLGFALGFAAMLCNTGCVKAPQWTPSKMFSLDNTWPFRDNDAPQEGTPVRMVTAWTDTVLTQPGQKPQRGFGGRLMFYGKEGKKPILVDGQLVVYAFDEAGRDPTDNKPTRRYVFPADQISLHMSKSDIGASYSFWLPWDEAGGPRMDISLICRFEPKNGAVVTSEQTRHLLPGTMPAAQVAGVKQPPKLPEGVPSKPTRQTLQSLQSSRAADERARLTSYEVPVATEQQPVASGGAADPSAIPVKRMTATTITLPSSYQMPAAAAAYNPAIPAPSYPQGGGQIWQQVAPNAAQPQQTMPVMRTYPTRQAAAIQPTSMNSNIGVSMMQQFPMSSQSTSTPPPMLRPAGWNNAMTSPVPQQQFQQPIAQQVILQPQVAPQPLPVQQGWPQMAAQTGATTAVNYPAPGQLPR